MNINELVVAQNGPEVQLKRGRPRVIIRGAAYALQPQPPIDWIVDKLITKGSLCVIYGEPGSKKTFSMLSMAVCVAAGKSWLGFTVKQTTVLIVDEESGERRLARRLGDALRGEFAGPETPIKSISLAQFNLRDSADITLFHTQIKETEAGLVIVDALADVMDGDENSKQDVQPIFNALRQIAEETNAAIIVIHHSNKNGRYRGSSAIKGSVDQMILIESENSSNQINFKMEKSRDGEPVNWSALATWTEDQFYLSSADYHENKKQPNKPESFVLAYLAEHGPSPLPEIKTGSDISTPEQIQKAVYALAKQNEIKRINPEEKGQGAIAIYDRVKKLDSQKAESDD